MKIYLNNSHFLMLTILWVLTGRAQWGPLFSDPEEFGPHLEWI